MPIEEYMQENKTKETKLDPIVYIQSIEDDAKRNDCMIIYKLFKDIIGVDAKMWGDSIIGFGTYHYKYESGREGDWFKVGFSPRKQNITLYLQSYLDIEDDLWTKLGKFKHGKACIYIKKLSDIQLNILEDIINKSIK